ncbi:hypothetical protein OIU76_004649 [Salix suchowensis]|nr:hypothetical protein OIU76_004649 [Salix suchowensis]
MGVDMSNPPNSHIKDFFASPALSLSLAGIFRGANVSHAAAAASVEVEEGDEGSGGGRREDTVEISSETSGPMRSRSDDDLEGEGEHDEDDGDGDGEGDDKNKKKKRKKYHRHTAEQIREMEALFKESPHPDEKQRQQLSKQLGLALRQVKFWFQNRCTQIKAIQERHENSLLKTEMDKLREENKTMRETINKACCPNCGTATTSRGTSLTAEEQQLRIENTKLKAEVEKLRAVIGKYSPGATASCSAGSDQENRSSLDFYTGIFGLDKTRITEIANQAMEELKKMATAGEPLWIRSVETGREILNYDEYTKEFGSEDSSNNGRPKRSIEASRETRVVFVDLPRLVQSFMDVNQWKEMFPCLISKAATVDVISNGEGANRNGAVQLMFAELKILLKWDIIAACHDELRIIITKRVQVLPVTILKMKSKENNMWVLQDSGTNAYESMVVYAPVDTTGMQSVINGCDSGSLAILPSGFSILPDGHESRPLVITSRQEEKSTEGGSLLTIAFQILTNTSPTAKLTMESVDSVNALISCTLKNIRTSLQCEDS